MTAPEWRDCADPDELAAAVAAGVEVLAMGRAGWSSGEWALSTASSPANFAGAMRRGNRYQLPTSWSPEPPADDEPCATNPCEACRGRAVRATDECTLAPDLVGLADGNEHPVTIPPADDLRERLRLGIEDAVNDYADVVMDIMDAEVVRHAGWLAARLEEADAERTTLRHRLVETMPTPPPAPPWPGAVLSGLTDEDGVPTWLAQAGQVRGEQVRACTSVPWLPNTSYGEDEWVEVRAPRAVPEPETERVPWWESVGRVVRDATGREAQILRADVGDGAGPSVYAYHDQEPGAALRRLYAPVNGFGTVEVLKDGDR